MNPTTNRDRQSSLKEIGRRLLHRLVKAALRARARSYPVEDQVRCLILAPHEDDATLGCGGLILSKRLEGNPVDILYVTDGSASHPSHPILTPDALARQRRSEALAAAATLGVEHCRTHFLDVRDGTLDRLSRPETDALVDQISQVLVRTRPDEILLPCRRDCSSEHDAAFILAQRALKRSGLKPRLLEYPIWSLWASQHLLRPLVTSKRVWRVEFSGYEHAKRSALGCFRSQVEPTPPWDQPVLPRDFVALFGSPEEFFFEMACP
jgi:LmbE family N-acetylglucosaminyl deacetylase